MCMGGECVSKDMMDLENKLWTLATIVSSKQIDEIIALAAWGFDFGAKLQEIDMEHEIAAFEFFNNLINEKPRDDK